MLCLCFYEFPTFLFNVVLVLSFEKKKLFLEGEECSVSESCPGGSLPCPLLPLHCCPSSIPEDKPHGVVTHLPLHLSLTRRCTCTWAFCCQVRDNRRARSTGSPVERQKGGRWPHAGGLSVGQPLPCSPASHPLGQPPSSLVSPGLQGVFVFSGFLSRGLSGQVCKPGLGLSHKESRSLSFSCLCLLFKTGSDLVVPD